VSEITRLLIDRVQRRLRAQHIEIQVEESAVEYLADLGFDPEFGARPLRRAIQREMENELSRLVLSGELAPDDRVVVEAGADGLAFEVQRGAAEISDEVDEGDEREEARPQAAGARA
jgi:ATP-dependent Clp protease ATP-binding subunit ClpC